MRKLHLTLACAAIVAVALFVRSSLLAQSAEHPAAGGFPTAGASCQVYLRGDAAGAAFHDRIPDLGNLISRKGTVLSADDTWLVLKEGDRQLYIPRTSIMLIEVGK